jgi:hypothetical protein
MVLSFQELLAKRMADDVKRELRALSPRKVTCAVTV